MTELQHATVILLALGHPDRGDDQFGPRLLRRFEDHYALPPQLECLQGGSRPLALYPELAGCRWLILLDAVQTDQPDQGIILRDPLSLPSPDRGYSSHQMGIAELLRLMAVLGDQPERISLIGAPFHTLVPGEPLSDRLAALLPGACEALAALLCDHGMAVHPLKADDSHNGEHSPADEDNGCMS